MCKIPATEAFVGRFNLPDGLFRSIGINWYAAGEAGDSLINLFKKQCIFFVLAA